MSKLTLSRITALLCAALMIVPMLAACSGGSDPAATTAAGVKGETTPVDTTPAETSRKDVKDGLAEKNYNGQSFNALIRTEWEYEHVAPELTGGTMNDAIYERNSAVESRFNVKLNWISFNGSWSAQSTFLGAIEGEVKAGTGAYDMADSYQAYMITPAMNGYLLNIYSVPNLDMTRPWWSEKCNETITDNGRLFLTTGDLNLSFWDTIYIYYFNKQVATDFKVNGIYDIVRDGKWTLDKLEELSAAVIADVNGDGKYDTNDRFGLLSFKGNFRRAYIVACETPITRLNSKGEMEACFNTEHTVNVLEKLRRVYCENNTTYYQGTELNEPIEPKMPLIFAENRALFMTGFLGQAETLREMESDFGIIPYPKFDDNQQGYHTTLHNSVSMVCFPVTVKDIDFAGVMTEALCAESYRTVVEPYYETCLKTRNSRDEESGEMIDMIRDTIMFDFGWVHSVPMDSIGTTYDTLVNPNSSDWASYWASKEPSVLAGLEKINAAYLKANE